MKLDDKQLKKLYIKAIKIGCGSFLAIIIAHTLGLQNQTSAGTIALLSIMTTRWETLRISLHRVYSFAVTVFLCWFIFRYLGSDWTHYGLIIFLMVMILEMVGWASTLSVNAVIAAHFVTEKDFSFAFILNEFLLVLIGITVAVLLNFFNNHKKSRKELASNMRYVEERLQLILEEMACYLSQEETKRDVWDDIRKLEAKTKHFVHEACQYRDNSFNSNANYYIKYFEMRLEQINMLHNLHYEVQKIRNMPDQAKIVAAFIRHIKEAISEMHSIGEQINRLQQIIQSRTNDHLPKDMNEFEGMAILYHIMMDLEDYLIIKRRFVNSLSEEYRQRDTFILE